MAKICLYDNDKGFEGVLRRLFMLMGAIVTILYYGAAIILFQPVLFVLLILNAIVPYMISFYSKKYEYTRQEELSSLNRKQGYINGIMSDFAYGKEIRLYNMKKILMRLSETINREELSVHGKILNRRLLAEMITLLINFFREGAVYLFLIYCFLKGDLSIGDFSLYIGMFLSFSNLLSEIIDGINHIRAQSLLISDYRSFMDVSEEPKEGTLQLDISNGCSIDLENVTFSYPGSGRKLFDHLNVHIDKREKVAIVGGNGAGKSTFVKLICGFYKPDAGRVLINGKDISLYSRDSVLRLFSALFQDISFFSLSVAENITLQNKEKIDVNRMRECLTLAGLYEKIDSLEDGADTTLTKILDAKGVEFSGGEYQKLAMSRMIYKNGQIFVLDEPTSALDSLAEEAIYKQIREITGNKTSVFVTHRLMSTRFCDRILVFQDGMVVEEGNHEKLMEQKGVYYNLS